MRCSEPSSSSYLWVVLLVGFVALFVGWLFWLLLIVGRGGCWPGAAWRRVCVLSLCVVTLNELDTSFVNVPLLPQKGGEWNVKGSVGEEGRRDVGSGSDVE